MTPRPSANVPRSPSREPATNGKPAEGGERFDWETLVSQVLHPMKVAIVEAIWCIGEPVTPNDLFHSFDGLGSLAVIAHHVRELTRMGVLRPVKQRPVRGARETFYFFSRKVWNVK